MKKNINVNTFRKLKESGEKITMLTAYDAPSGAIAGNIVDAILVGDSLGMTVLGYSNTLPVTMEEMLHHVKAVRRGAPDAFIVGDMPFMSYQTSIENALYNAGRMLKEANANAIKLEGGAQYAELIEKLVQSGIPVMAHIGLLPQHVMSGGGYKVVGRKEDEAKRLIDDALKLEAAGAFLITLECIPATLAKKISESVSVPTIGIGSGIDCDGQIQVLNDIWGMFEDFTPKHTKRYAEIGKLMREAVDAYAKEVKSNIFPTKENSF